MSVINLCQITELSKDYKNVYDFYSTEEQLTFMRSRVILQLETNAKIDNFTDSITLNYGMNGNIRKCDYMFSQGIDGKYLFFFIDNVEQITTSTVKLYLTLDVWQTYFLYIDLKPSYVVRQHVPRWFSTGLPNQNETIDEGFPNEEYILVKSTKVTNGGNHVKNNEGTYIYTTSSPLSIAVGGSSTDSPVTNVGYGGNPSMGIISARGYRFIKGYEGYAPYLYDDGYGTLTIGYGCTSADSHYEGLKANQPVSEETASIALGESIINEYGVVLASMLAEDGVDLTQIKINEFDAFASYVFNCGPNIRQDDIYQLYIKGANKKDIYKAWLTSRITSNGKPSAGLEARRKAEATIFLSEVYEYRDIVKLNNSGSIAGVVTGNDGHGYIPSVFGSITGIGEGIWDCKDEMGNAYTLPTSGTITAIYPNYPESFGGGTHTGIDIANEIGTEIYAPSSGKVLEIKHSQGGYGTHVILQLDNGCRCWLGHMNQIDANLSVNQVVNQNTRIGYMGSTGNSSGPHLHFEIRVSPYIYGIHDGFGDGCCINPMVGYKVGDVVKRGEGVVNNG